MCIAAVIFSLIPILSGYAVYLAFATVITRGSPEVQWTVGLLLAAAVAGALIWAAGRVRRRYAAQTALDAADAEAGLEPQSPNDKGNVTKPA